MPTFQAFNDDYLATNTNGSTDDGFALTPGLGTSIHQSHQGIYLTTTNHLPDGRSQAEMRWDVDGDDLTSFDLTSFQLDNMVTGFVIEFQDDAGLLYQGFYVAPFSGPQTLRFNAGDFDDVDHLIIRITMDDMTGSPDGITLNGFTLSDMQTPVVDTTPPAFEEDPALIELGENDADIRVDLDEAGAIHWIMQTEGMSDPTAEQVRQGLLASDAAAAHQGTLEISSSPFVGVIEAANLPSSTGGDLVIWIAAEDAAGNLNPVPTPVALVDQRPAVSLSVSAPSATEGETVTITATLDEASDEDVTVTLDLDGGTASSDDYTIASPTITISAGETSATTTLMLTDDKLDEAEETVSIGIQEATNAQVSEQAGTAVSIVDNDPAPVVTLSVSASQVSESGGTAQLIATLDAPSARTVTISLDFAGDAKELTDYLAGREITILPGDMSGSTGFYAFNDNVEEETETLEISIASVQNATEASPQSTTITIIDDDTGPRATSITLHKNRPDAPADTVTFEVVFDSPVTGVDTSDFQVSAAGSGGASITSAEALDGNRDRWIVEIDGAAADEGELRLDLINNMSIRNDEGVALFEGREGDESAVIDRTPPDVVLHTVSDDDLVNAYELANGVAVRFTTTEQSGDATLSLRNGDHEVLLGQEFTAGENTFNLSHLEFAQAGDYTLTLTLTDAAGNSTDVTRDVVIDPQPPAVVQAIAHGVTVELLLNEAVEKVDPDHFMITASGQPIPISDARLGQDGTTITLDLLLPISPADIVEVSYTNNFGDEYPLADAAGNVMWPFFGIAENRSHGTNLYLADGAQVERAASGEGSNALLYTMVEPVTSNRIDHHGRTDTADIALASDEGGVLLRARISEGYGLSSIGVRSPLAAKEAPRTLSEAIESVVESEDDLSLMNQVAEGFKDEIPDQSDVLINAVRVINPPTADAPPSTGRLVLSSFSAESDMESALVLDFEHAHAGQVKARDIDFVAVSGFGRVSGSKSDDIFVGDAADQILHTHGGNDQIHGGGGSDIIRSGQGDDRAFGGDGDDLIFTGSGSDLARGGQGNDTIYGRGDDDFLFGGDGRDEVYGGSGDDLLRGGRKADVLHGGPGDDQLYGNQNRDQLYGGFGDDYLDGGFGNDLLFGGAGADTFAYAQGGRDVIGDFQVGIDQIAISRTIAGSAVESATDLMSLAVDRKAGVVFDFGDGDRLVVADVDLADLSRSDMILL